MSVEEVLRADAWARARARKVLGLPQIDAEATETAGVAP
jgi:1-deoxy-D-xylulose-5-phosphate reductoisomerase